MSTPAPSMDYAPTAYRSRRKTQELVGPCEHGTLFRKGWTMGAPLSKGRLSGLYPPKFLEIWGPKDMVESDETIKGFEAEAEQGGEPFEPMGWINGESIRYATLPKSSWALLWMQYGGRFAFLMLFPLYLLVILFGWLQVHENPRLMSLFLGGAIDTILFLFVPLLLCWGTGWLLEKKFPHFIYRAPKGPQWELNRRTGLVTLFHNPAKEQAGQVRAQAPFHEWDGYLLSLPDRQGNLWHRLVLVHKTQEWALPLNQLVAATTNREDVLAYWDLIRQYMDVSKPLPDIPLFESYRALDPTTHAYDDKIGRAPRYWRDMDDETYAAFKRDNQTKLWRHSWS